MCASGNCSYCQNERAEQYARQEKEDARLKAEFAAAIEDRVAGLSPNAAALWAAIGELADDGGLLLPAHGVGNSDAILLIVIKTARGIPWVVARSS